MYTTTKRKGIHHVCLKTADLARTVAFYMEGLGARFVVEWGKDGGSDHAVLVDLGDGDFLEIFESPESFPEGRWQHVAVRTEDIEQSVRRAELAGGIPRGQPRDADIPARSGEIIRMRFCFVDAPGGESIEFIEDR
jgi:catechol 2,3-dioxygenase-like lactoylglutathione lyase family enzyme